MEAIGHSQAFDFLFTCSKKDTISEDDVKELHRLFYYRIDLKKAGSYRKEKVFITGSKYAVTPPEAISEQMVEFVAELPDIKSRLHPVEFAALVHKRLVFIHPFVDGNGRVARLLMNLILMQAGYTITIIPPIVRHQYIMALEKAHRDDKNFIMLIAQMVKETQADWLRLFV